jgi:hypothetical protein
MQKKYKILVAHKHWQINFYSYNKQILPLIFFFFYLKKIRFFLALPFSLSPLFPSLALVIGLYELLGNPAT